MVTANFKKAYAKATNAKQVAADPAFNAREVPSKPFKAGKLEIIDTTATVVLVTSFGREKYQLTATLVKVSGVWLLDSVK